MTSKHSLTREGGIRGRGVYEDWRELVRRRNANGSLSDSEQSYFDEMEEASGLTFRARHAKEMRARAGGAGTHPKSSAYCSKCRGPHVYKHGRA